MKFTEGYMSPVLKALGVEKDCKMYRSGKLVVMVGTMPGGQKHLSISHPSRFPTWEEIKTARYELLPEDLDMAMYLPSKEKYVNVHENCFHLFECSCYEGLHK